jgi:DNA-binding response OmpR family regulator
MRQCRHGFGAPRVLVVEDEGLIASVAAESLADEGYAVRTAGDGRAALQQVLASGADGPLLWDANIRIADVIRKPFSLEQLVATAERLATQRSPDQHRTRRQPPDRGMRPAPSAVIAVVSCGDRRRCRRLTGR